MRNGIILIACMAVTFAIAFGLIAFNHRATSIHVVADPIERSVKCCSDGGCTFVYLDNVWLSLSNDGCQLKYPIEDQSR